MVDADDKVVIIDVNDVAQVLFKATGTNWKLETGVNDFRPLFTELGTIEVNGVKESYTTEFTVGGVDYSFNSNRNVITPDLEVE